MRSEASAHSGRSRLTQLVGPGPLTAHRSPLTAHRSPLTAHRLAASRATSDRSAAVLSAAPSIRVAHTRHASVFPTADHVGRHTSARPTADHVGRRASVLPTADRVGRNASARPTADRVGCVFHQTTASSVAGNSKNGAHLCPTHKGEAQ